MEDQDNKKFLWPVVIFVAAIIGLVMANNWLQKQADSIVANSMNTSTVKPLPPTTVKVTQPKKRRGEVTRKTRLAPGRTYETSIFYQEGREIARHKVSRGKVYDQSGEIPDGRVKFINESDETYGEEHYRGGEKHGEARTYYSEGQLALEASYRYGRVITRKEYYSDGIVRMEEDYGDARDDRGRKESGVGKVYFRDGMLKYEWRLINSEAVGFKKSYNRRGELVAEFYYDEYDREIQPPPAPPTTPRLATIPAPVFAPVRLDVPVEEITEPAR